MIGGVLFDVDGTLIDSNDLHAACWLEAFRHFGIVVPYDDIRFQVGKGGDNLIPSLLPPELVERLQQDIESFRSDLFKRDYLPKARPFAGASDLLRHLHDEGVGLVLATSSKQEELDTHIEKLGCRHLLTATVSRDDVEHSKPCPDVFEAALAKAEAPEGSKVVVVGDTPWDIEAAGRLGIPAIGVLSGGFLEDELAGAAAIYDGPQHLLAAWPRWLGN